MPSDQKSRLRDTVAELEDSMYFKAIDIVVAREPGCFKRKDHDDDYDEIDFDRLGNETLWELHGFVEPCYCDGAQGDCVESDGAPWRSDPTKSPEGWRTKCKITVTTPAGGEEAFSTVKALFVAKDWKLEDNVDGFRVASAVMKEFQNTVEVSPKSVKFKGHGIIIESIGESMEWIRVSP